MWIGSTEYVGNKGINSSPFKAVSKKKIKANFLLDYDRNFTQYIIEAKSHPLSSFYHNIKVDGIEVIEVLWYQVLDVAYGSLTVWLGLFLIFSKLFWVYHLIIEKI